jgi:hypothetical protein
MLLLAVVASAFVCGAQSANAQGAFKITSSSFEDGKRLPLDMATLLKKPNVDHTAARNQLPPLRGCWFGSGVVRSYSRGDREWGALCARSLALRISATIPLQDL